MERCVGHGEFLGFFSTVESVVDGDSGFSVKKTYWHVWDAGPRSVSVQKLGPDFKPAGPILPLSRNELENSFSPETDMAERPENLDLELVRFIAGNKEGDSRPISSRRSGSGRVSGSPDPASRLAEDVAKAPASGASRPAEERDAPDPDMPDSVFERRESARRKRLCKVAEEKVRTLFIRDLDEFLQGVLGEDVAFRAPLEVKADWLPEYKHMFSHLAVRLRKLNLYKRAIDYHSKALELAPEDYHIYFNMACAHYALGDVKNASRWLNRILAVAPDMDLARRFLDYISEHEAPARESAPGASGDRPARPGGPATSGVTRVSDPLPRAPRSGRSSGPGR